MPDYCQFRQEFVNHFYNKYHKQDKSLSLDKIQAKIEQKWNSYQLSQLRDFFIIFCLNNNLNHIEEFDLKFEDWFSRNMCLRFDGTQEKECVKFCKDCAKEFKSRNNPAELRFKMEYEEVKSEDEKPKTPTKDKEKQKKNMDKTAETVKSRQETTEMKDEILDSPQPKKRVARWRTRQSNEKWSGEQLRLKQSSNEEVAMNVVEDMELYGRDKEREREISKKFEFYLDSMLNKNKKTKPIAKMHRIRA